MSWALMRTRWPAFRTLPSQEVANAEGAGDRLHVGSLAAKRLGGVTRDDEQPGDLRQVGGQVLGHAIGERLLLGVGGITVER